MMEDQRQQERREAHEAAASRPGWGPASEHASETPSDSEGGLSPGQLATPTRIGQDLHPFLTGASQHIPTGPSLPAWGSIALMLEA